MWPIPVRRLPCPGHPSRDFAALEGSEISTDAIKDTSDDLERAAEELRKASEDTAKAKRARLAGGLWRVGREFDWQVLVYVGACEKTSRTI